MFINCSNHKSKYWGAKQINEASMWGSIVDYPFPPVDPLAGKEDIIKLAADIVKQMLEKKPKAVMCQGEFTLTFEIVSLLKAQGITVLCACSERRIIEEHFLDGKSEKKVVFEFVQFREY